MNKCDEEFPICENENPHLVCKNDDQSLLYFNALPKSQYAKRSKVLISRELLKQLNSLTFVVLEEETLDKIEEDLGGIVKDLKLQVPYEAGLIKESSSYVRSSSNEMKKSVLYGKDGTGAERSELQLLWISKTQQKNSPVLKKN